jgi:hypothetical protein
MKRPNHQECFKILNSGTKKYTLEQVKSIVSLLQKIAKIEYENFKKDQNERNNL